MAGWRTLDLFPRSRWQLPRYGRAALLGSRLPRRLLRGARLVVASHNPGKVWEINQLLAPHGLHAISAADLALAEPEETEPTFAANACLKAVAASKGSGLPALGDDSGLEVDALDGAPGIYSARWAGPERDFGVAMRRLHDELAARGAWPGEPQTTHVGIPPTPKPSPQGGREPPPANLTSVLCLAWPDGKTDLFEGKVHGCLVWPPRGGNGFGYDPMFLADGETETFGEMEPARKYAMSHRTRAFAKFVKECLDAGD